MKTSPFLTVSPSGKMRCPSVRSKRPDKRKPSFDSRNRRRTCSCWPFRPKTLMQKEINFCRMREKRNKFPKTASDLQSPSPSPSPSSSLRRQRCYADAQRKNPFINPNDPYFFSGTYSNSDRICITQLENKETKLNKSHSVHDMSSSESTYSSGIGESLLTSATTPCQSAENLIAQAIKHMQRKECHIQKLMKQLNKETQDMTNTLSKVAKMLIAENQVATNNRKHASSQTEEFLPFHPESCFQSTPKRNSTE